MPGAAKALREGGVVYQVLKIARAIKGQPKNFQLKSSFRIMMEGGCIHSHHTPLAVSSLLLKNGITEQLVKKVKVVPYTFVSRGVAFIEDTYPEPSACEVGWPVPFLAAFISQVLPPGTHLLLGEKCASIESRPRAVDLPHRSHAL